jgi:uncharacterized BrkB/YihY/UPF0761 family membrane protein
MALYLFSDNDIKERQLFLSFSIVFATMASIMIHHDIQHFGLAYKRIGVLVFLALVLIGLVTIFVKIPQRKTAFYLVRVNAWFAIAILVVTSCVHWDETIARYNLARKDTMHSM